MPMNITMDKDLDLDWQLVTRPRLGCIVDDQNLKI